MCFILARRKAKTDDSITLLEANPVRDPALSITTTREITRKRLIRKGSSARRRKDTITRKCRLGKEDICKLTRRIPLWYYIRSMFAPRDFGVNVCVSNALQLSVVRFECRTRVFVYVSVCDYGV